MKITVAKDLSTRRGSARAARNYATAKRRTRRERGKKAAYAPGAKKAFKRMSNPLAENKQLLGSEIAATVGLGPTGDPILTDLSIPPIDSTGTPTGAGGHAANTSHFHFNPDSALYQTQGLDESQMIGRSTYQTITAAKMLIKWPQPCMNTGIRNEDDNDYLYGVIPECPMSYKLYWGFVPYKYLFTDNTSPKASECSALQLEQLINQRVTDYFNARTDRVQFIPKKTSTIDIIGSKRVFPPNMEQAGRVPVSLTDSEDSVNAGSLPDTLVKMKWPCNRKIHFEPTNKFATNGSNEPAPPTNNATVFYRNYSGKLPFAVLVSWNHDKLPINDSSLDPDEQHERTRRCPQVLINDITYYRDS